MRMNRPGWLIEAVVQRNSIKMALTVVTVRLQIVELATGAVLRTLEGVSHAHRHADPLRHS